MPLSNSLRGEPITKEGQVHDIHLSPDPFVLILLVVWGRTYQLRGLLIGQIPRQIRCMDDLVCKLPQRQEFGGSICPVNHAETS